MNNRLKTKSALLCAVSMVAISPAAMAQDQAAPQNETVTVTGSRVLTNVADSPTPLTVVTTEQLSATTPSDIPDALNKLPDFLGGSTPRSQNNGSTNNSGNTLNLRNLGVSRTLVLVDGHRVAPSNQNGTVDVDTLPQMMMSRVDVVTGGASAVYGSDAVAGVVNFILDKNFDGFKYNLNGGISKYGDAASQQLGFAWGTDLFGGRGHIEASARYFNQDMIPIDERPYGYQNNTWALAGNGTPAAPYTNVPFGRLYNQSQHGTITCGSGNKDALNNPYPSCTLNNYTFNADGSIRPMIHGIPTTTSGLESGGDGGYETGGTLQARLRTAELFVRGSYDLDNETNIYIQSAWAESYDYSSWAPLVVSSAASRPDTFFTNNAFLSPTVQTQLTTAATIAGNFVPAPILSPQTNSMAPAVAANTPFFKAPSYNFEKIDGNNARTSGDYYQTIGVDRNFNVEIGATGKLGNFNWDAYYNHGDNRTETADPTNTNNARYMASLDAVIAPAGTKIPQIGSTTGATVDVSGTIQCWDVLPAAGAVANALYAGCVPLDAFNPDGASQEAYNYIKQRTFWILEQHLDNIGASINGGLFGLGLPAGEITAALSGEMRWRDYNMQTNALPTDYVNCTGLRMCTVNGAAAPVLWTQNVNAPVNVSDNVWEMALEVNVPLLKDVPLAQDLNADIAGRYTDYSISGVAETWKVGINDRVNDSIRLRGTMSVDIRAPNLNDLFQPVGLSSTGFNDLLTKANNSTQLITKGNSGLIPEVAHTETAGFVLTPSFLPDLTFSLDWYTTHMSGAITSISFQSTSVQQICNNSAPAYNSPYCSLVVRPLAVGDPNYTTGANYPLQVLSSPQNSAKVFMEGWDVEIDYHFDLADIMESLPGSVSIRDLITYQPVNETQNVPGVLFTTAVAPKTRMTTFLTYTIGEWGIALQNQWLSGMSKTNCQPNTLSGNFGCSQYYAVPRINAYNVLDVTIDRKVEVMGGAADLYLNIQNIGNTRAPLYPTNASNPGLFYPTAGFYSDVGRFFTVGIKGNL